MSTSTTTSFADVSAAIAVGLRAASQELIVLCVFLLSYGIWRHLGLVNRRSQAARKLNATDGPKKPSMEAVPRSFARAREVPQKRMEADASTKAAEAHMLALDILVRQKVSVPWAVTILFLDIYDYVCFLLYCES